MSEVVRQITKHVCTTEDVVSCIRAIETAGSDQKKLPFIVKSLIPAEAESDEKKLLQWLQKIVTELKQLPVATLTVAYIPSTQEAQELLRLLRANLDEQLVVQLKTDPSFLAGIRVEYDNKRVQYSLEEDLHSSLNKEHNVDRQ